MSKTLKQYGESEVRQISFERLGAVSNSEIGKNPAMKIREARDEIPTKIRNKELGEISQIVERLRTEIQDTNLALESCRKRLDFFIAGIKELKTERRKLRSKISEIATERVRLIIRRNELERSGSSIS